MRGAARRGVPPGKGRRGWGESGADRRGCPGAAGWGSLVTLCAPPTFQGGETSPAAEERSFPAGAQLGCGGTPARAASAGGEPPPGAACSGGDTATLAPEPRGNELPPDLGCCWARSCRLEQVSPRWQREVRCPARPCSRASRRSECPGVCCQTSRRSEKPAVRAQDGEEISQSGVQARHSMEQSYGKAVRSEVWALDAAVGWGHCKKSVLRC